MLNTANIHHADIAMLACSQRYAADDTYRDIFNSTHLHNTKGTHHE